MMRDRDEAGMVRGIAARAVVRATNDKEGAQLADVTVYRDVQRSGVEVLQQFGVASRPRPGSLAVVIAIGGDQGDMVALPVSDPGDRMGGLEEGETAIYGSDGTRVHIRADGSINETARTRIVSQVEGMRAEMTADSLVTTIGETRVEITAGAIKLEAAGQVVTLDASGFKHNGKNIGDTHVHGEVTPGLANTGIPAN